MLDCDQLAAATGEVATLRDSEGFHTARLLVRDGRIVLGLVECAVLAGSVSLEALRAQVESFPRTPSVGLPSSRRHITIVLCTRDRPDHLRSALDSLANLDYPDHDLLVIDNAPSSTATADLVRERYPQVRLVTETVAGLSAARNTGLREATGELVAFTDDDVMVDKYWLAELAAGFENEDVACVSGLVAAGELRTPAQRYFEARVAWSTNVRRRRFRLSEPPADLPMFPFSVGEFGTGANFAVRRTTALALGGFDTCLGVGTATGGGEDLDFFTRVLFAGHTLVMQPSAIIWHRHRADVADLRAQARGYGMGLGAWLAKVALDPTMRNAAARRAPRALRRLIRASGRQAPGVGAMDRDLVRLGRYELACVLRGPARYLRERRRGQGPLVVSGR
jgi:GT2 family glycosyltransferase